MPNPSLPTNGADHQKQPPGGAGTPDRAGNTTDNTTDVLDFTEFERVAKEFIGEVVPVTPGGHYGLWTKHNKRHHWFDSHEVLVAAHFGEFRDTPDTYYVTAVCGDAISEKTGQIARTQANVLKRLCLHADMDCGAEKYAKDPEGTYPTWNDAITAMSGAVKSKAIPPPNYVLSSGTGIHAYWCFDRATDRHQWDTLAKGLSRTAKAAGLKFDPACTTDSARILRLPGALHNCGARVRVLWKGGAKYAPEQLAQILGASDTVAPLSGSARKQTGINDEVLAHDSPPADFTGIVQGCGAVRWAAEPANQPKVSRHYWRGLLGIVKHCEGAHELAHEVSKHHPEYDPEVTERELDGWTVPPTTCEFFSRFDAINGGACTNCPHGTGGAA